MSNQKNIKLLETVIEELEADKGKTKRPDQKCIKPVKSAKSKSGGKAKKSKRDKSLIEKATDENFHKIVVEVPLTKNNDNQNTAGENQSKHEIQTGTDVERDFSKQLVVTTETKLGTSERETNKNNTENVTGEHVESSNAKVDDISASNRLFTHVFSIKDNETHSAKKDLIITPNGSTRDSGVHNHRSCNDKENILGDEPHVQSQDFIRSNSDKSILTTRSEPNGNKIPKLLPRRRRPMSTSALSKKALEAYLPRKSFFSSHDKVLREAGFQVDDAMKNKKRPNWRLILRMHTDEELNPDLGTELENSSAKEPQIKGESDENGEGTTNLLDAIDTLMSQEKDNQTSKKKFKIAAKKLGMEEKCDYKPLLDYLKYINDHPDEYMGMARYSSKNTDYKHPSVMVRMARVYRKAHHGTARNNIFTHALAGLKPKIIDSTVQQRHGRGEHSRTDFGTTKKDQTDVPQEQSGTPQDEGKTEMEKLKLKTEKWMGSLNTMQTLKAKELALKEMGEEDITVTKWWLAFKTCNYLRIPPTVLEQAQ